MPKFKAVHQIDRASPSGSGLETLKPGSIFTITDQTEIKFLLEAGAMIPHKDLAGAPVAEVPVGPPVVVETPVATPVVAEAPVAPPVVAETPVAAPAAEPKKMTGAEKRRAEKSAKKTVSDLI